MWVVKVKDRGRDLVKHVVERAAEARQLARVYELLGYKPERITVEQVEKAEEPAA